MRIAIYSPKPGSTLRLRSELPSSLSRKFEEVKCIDGATRLEQEVFDDVDGILYAFGPGACPDHMVFWLQKLKVIGVIGKPVMVYAWNHTTSKDFILGCLERREEFELERYIRENPLYAVSIQEALRGLRKYIRNHPKQ